MDTLKLNKMFSELIAKKNINLFKLKNNYLLQNPKLLYEKYINIIDNNINKLELLNPLSSLKRGYAIVKKENKCIENVKNIKIDDKINIVFKNGNVDAEVISIKEEV